MRQLIKGKKNSVIFWNGIFLLSYIITMIYDFSLFVMLYWIIGSFALFVFAIFCYDTENFTKNQYWILLIPLAWLLLICGGAMLSLEWLYKNTIIRFNKFLDDF